MISFQTASGLSLIDTRGEASAADACKARQANMSVLPAALNDSLRAHPRKAGEKPRDWGFEGDLGFVQGRLQEIADFLASAS